MKNEEKKKATQEQFRVFKEVWDEREDEMGNNTCYESGTYLEPNKYRSLSTCYHHVLEKGKYPQYRLTKSNIVILHPDVHTRLHQSIDNAPRVKKLREKLLSLHYENKLI